MARSLNKLKDGVPYARRPVIEACIDQALLQSEDTILRRAAIRRPKDPEYLPMETLLHLAQESWLRGDKVAAGRLLAPFFSRCEARLKKAIPDGGRADAGGMREEILQEFGELFARVGTNHDSTALDYYEVNFNHAFQVLIQGHLRQERRHKSELLDIAQEVDEDGTPLDDEGVLATLAEAARCPAQQENHVYLSELGRFIQTLPPGEKEALLLVLVKGFKIESEDPEEETAASICGVSGRMIRYRLKSAAAALKKFKQE